jgi:thiol:disulfide interchange protein
MKYRIAMAFLSIQLAGGFVLIAVGLGMSLPAMWIPGAAMLALLPLTGAEAFKEAPWED